MELVHWADAVAQSVRKPVRSTPKRPVIVATLVSLVAAESFVQAARSVAEGVHLLISAAIIAGTVEVGVTIRFVERIKL